MKLLLSEGYYNKLESIGKRAELSQEELDKIMDWMLFRQAQLLLKAPKNYTASLIRSKRIRGVDSADCENKRRSILIEDILSELEKARGRFGTGVSEIADAKISDEELITKMLLAEIDMMCRKNSQTRRYKKSQFRVIKNQIERLSQSISFSSRLEEAMQKYELDKKYFLYYLLLSAKIPNSVNDNKAVTESYIKNAVEVLSKAIEKFIKDADDGIHYRKTLEIMRDLKEHEIDSFRIRNALNGGEYFEKLKEQDLHRYVKEKAKENDDKF